MVDIAGIVGVGAPSHPKEASAPAFSREPQASAERAPHTGKTFCEFFAGIGLVGAGLKPSGWRCVYANDHDADKQELYEALNGPSPHYHLADVNNTGEVVVRIPGRATLATASFPCVDLSLAGHYRGLAGRESSTFFAFTAILKALGDRRPPLIMLENVPGFLTANGGRDFVTAAEPLASLGYFLDALMLDARYFTPQSRRRVFVVGMLGGVQSVPRAHILRPPGLVELLRSLRLPTGLLGLDLPQPPTRRHDLGDVVERGDDLDWWNEDEVERHYRMMSDAHRRLIDDWMADGGSYIGAGFRRVRRDGQRLEVRGDGLAGCLRTPRGGSAKQIILAVDSGCMRMRWMTPREYARLQGVDDFPLVGTRNQQLFGFADAVCVPAIRWIDENVLTPLYESLRPARRNGRAGQPPA